MKHFITTIILCLLICSCSSQKYEYTITYNVYYSNEVIKTYKATYVGKNNQGFYIGSDRGSNYIHKYGITGPVVIDTSAPIEIVSNTYRKIENDR